MVIDFKMNRVTVVKNIGENKVKDQIVLIAMDIQ